MADESSGKSIADAYRGWSGDDTPAAPSDGATIADAYRTPAAAPVVAPLDTQLTTAQQARERDLEESANKSGYFALEPKEPGFNHLLWSLGAPFARIGQTALGERPFPTGANALDMAAPMAGVGDIRFGGRIVPAPRGDAAPPAGPISPEAPPAPRSVGAAETTVPIPEQTIAERASNLRSDVGQTAADRTSPAMREAGVYPVSEQPYPRDDNVYVEGIPPRPEAYRDFNAQTALDHKTFYRDDAAYRADMDRINKERHDGMSQPLKEMIGNDNTLKAAEAFRREVTPDSMGVFADEKPVDSTLLTAFTDKLNNLRDTFSKRKGIMSILNDVHSTLFDADGNPEVLPSKLQGVRDNMTDWLAKKHGTTNESKDVQAASAALTGLVEDLNPVMNSGAPKWDLWRQEWASRSRPINRQEFLQDYDVGRPKSLWDQTGKLIPRKLQALVADIANAHSDKPVHDAHSLTDAEIQQIVNTRNELATEDFARMQAEVGGSPTTQLLANSLKRGSGVAAQTLKRGVEAGLHATGIMTANPLINAGVGAWQISAPARAARAVAKQQATLTEQTNALKQNLLSQRGGPLSGGGGP